MKTSPSLQHRRVPRRADSSGPGTAGSGQGQPPGPALSPGPVSVPGRRPGHGGRGTEAVGGKAGQGACKQRAQKPGGTGAQLRSAPAKPASASASSAARSPLATTANGQPRPVPAPSVPAVSSCFSFIPGPSVPCPYLLRCSAAAPRRAKAAAIFLRRHRVLCSVPGGREGGREGGGRGGAGLRRERALPCPQGMARAGTRLVAEGKGA